MKDSDKKRDLDKIKEDLNTISNFTERFRWYLIGVVVLTVVVTIIEILLT